MMKAETLTKLYLGRQGDNVLPVREIDVSAIRAKYPDAVKDIIVKRPTEKAEDAYIAATSLEGDVISWPIQSGDVALPGYGRAQIVATFGDGHWYGPEIMTEVRAGIVGVKSETPAPAVPWTNQVLEAAASVRDMP